MRLFLALVPRENLRAGIHALGSSWRRAHPDLKWVPPENYHFTLRFIGETATELLPDLERAGLRPQDRQAKSRPSRA